MTNVQRFVLTAIFLMGSAVASLIMVQVSDKTNALQFVAWTIFFAAIQPWYMLFRSPGAELCFFRRRSPQA